MNKKYIFRSHVTNITPNDVHIIFSSMALKHLLRVEYGISAVNKSKLVCDNSNAFKLKTNQKLKSYGKLGLRMKIKCKFQNT